MENFQTFIDDLTFIHDVECPICGLRATFEITGRSSFKTSGCGHKDFLDEIERREQLILSKGSTR